MANPAFLTIEGKSFEVMSLDYELSTTYNNNYKPSTSAPQGGIINFTIRSPLKGTLLFHEWLLTPKLKKEGYFILPITHRTEQSYKGLTFHLAHCINLHEYYNASDASQVYMRITIVASVIAFGENVTYFQPGLDPDEKKKYDYNYDPALRTPPKTKK